MVNNMKKGFGTPLVKIMDMAGTVITDRFGNSIGRAVSEFKYKYDQDHGDACDITFHTKDPLFADGRYFRRQVGLLVRWGYINSQNSDVELGPTRTVAISDVNTYYGADGIKVCITCEPYSTMVKKMASATGSSNTFIDFLDKICKGKCTWAVSREGDTLYKSGQGSPAQRDPKSGMISTAKDNTAIAFQTWMNDAQPFIDAGRNPYIVMKNRLQYAPGGPYTAEMRDGNLEIKGKYNFNQKSTRTYTYKGGNGDLLSFNPRSEDNLPDMVSMQGHQLDPLKKDITSLNRLVTSKPSVGTTGTEPDNPAGTSSKVGQSDYNSPTGPRGESIESMESNFITQVMKPYFDQYYSGKDADGNVVLKQEAPKIPTLKIALESNQSMGTFESDGFKTAKDHDLTLGMTIVPLSLLINGVAGNIENHIDNALKDAFYKKFTADAKVLGDPFLTSDIILTFRGVSKCHGGSYYVLKATHHITPHGEFTVDLDMIMTPEETEMINHSGLNVITKSQSALKLIDSYKTTVVPDLNKDGKHDINDVLLETDAEAKAFYAPKPVAKASEDTKVNTAPTQEQKNFKTNLDILQTELEQKKKNQ
jgi:hypothetical protein